nr:MAG TPA: hypothetical protein [Caudoviricetes sp.]
MMSSMVVVSDMISFLVIIRPEYKDQPITARPMVIMMQPISAHIRMNSTMFIIHLPIKKTEYMSQSSADRIIKNVTQSTPNMTIFNTTVFLKTKTLPLG